MRDIPSRFVIISNLITPPKTATVCEKTAPFSLIRYVFQPNGPSFFSSLGALAP